MIFKFLQWLSSFFAPKNLSSRDDYALDLYTPGEKGIYSYFNGTEIIKEDPMVLHKRLMDVGPELSIDMKVASSPFKDAKEAHNKMLEKVRKIFDLKPFKDGGLTEVQAIELFDHFLTYEDFQKKIANLPTTEPTAPWSSSPPSSAESPPTSSPTASGSTASGPSTGTPPSTPTASASPSEPLTPVSTTTLP